MLLLVLFEVDVSNVQAARESDDEKGSKILRKDFWPIRADSDAKRERGELEEPGLPPRKRAVAEDVHRN